MHSARGVCEDLASQADVCTRMGSAFFGALLGELLERPVQTNEVAHATHLRNSADFGAPARLDAPLEVLERHGCDLNPLGPSTADDACTLLGFIWPDQTERFNRLRAALEIARNHRAEVVRADGITRSRTAASPRDGSAAVLLHAVVTEHLTPAQRESLRETISDLAARAKRTRPFAWIRMEPAQRGYRTILTHWPAGEETVIAASDGHAQHLRWNP
ncbi:MAG TPA: DUF2332 family protein [Candidatus Baltobacteraceae bacterium]|nr:DUF2332 family protein [Candidatus Baltobacteraceae bacterium]